MSNQAWVTLATNDSYGLGALVLAYSLRRVNSAHPAVVLITPSVTEPMRDRLRAVFADVVTVDVLDSRDAAHLALLQRPELGITFTKIHCWNLTQYEKCVFLDADILVVQNCDELFDREELSAAPDVGWPDCFNSGVFVFRPSADTFSRLIKFAQERGSFDGGDQGLLNSFFSDWAHGDINKHLPFLYNVTSAAFYSYLPALKHFGQDLKIIHFIGAAKPWLQQFNWESRSVDAPEHLRGFLQLWWDLFVGQVHSQLDISMSGVAGNLARVVPGASGSQREALDELTRRQGWEAGNVDYMGADSFDNIWAKISQTLNQTRLSPPKQSPPREIPPSVKEPSPTKEVPQPEPVQETPTTEVKAPVTESAEVPQESAPTEAVVVIDSAEKVIVDTPSSAPLEAAAPIEAAEPIESVPFAAAAPTESTSVEAAAPTESTPVEAAAPTESTPVEAVAPTESTPVEAAAPTESTPVEAAAPVEAALVESAAPTEVVPVAAATPTEVVPVAADALTETTPVESVAPSAAAPVETVAPAEAAPVIVAASAVSVEVAAVETVAPSEVPLPAEVASTVDTPVDLPVPVEAAIKTSEAIATEPSKPEPDVKQVEVPAVVSKAAEETATPTVEVPAPETKTEATPLKTDSSTTSLDSPPLVTDSTSKATTAASDAKLEERRKPAGKLQLSPPAVADPLPTPDSEAEDAAALAQSIIASELRPAIPSPSLPTPPAEAVSLAQIGVKPSKKSTTASQIESSITPSSPTETADPPKKKVVKKVLKKEGDAPVPPPRKKEKKPKDK